MAIQPSFTHTLSASSKANPLAQGITQCVQAAMQSVMERAVAIIGNLSGDERHFVALREAGVMQRLVQLLEQSPESRIPEIAARTLAILAGNDSNQTAIRLAGMMTAWCPSQAAQNGTRVLVLVCRQCPAHHESTVAAALSLSCPVSRWHSTPDAAAHHSTQ